MKSLHNFLNSLIFAGLTLGVAGSVFAGQGPAQDIAKLTSDAASNVPKASEGVLPYLKSGLWYAVTHPKVTLPALGLSGLLCLYYIRSNGKNWQFEIDEAKNETRYLDATAKSPATLRSKYRYWLIEPGSAQNLAQDYKLTYRELRNLFPKKGDKQEFVKQTIRDIDAEKKELQLISDNMDQILAESTLFPRMPNYDPKVDNPARVVIESYLDEQKNPLYLLKTKTQFEDLNKKINAIAYFSLSSLFNMRPWKTFNWHRFYTLPYEADAIEQYWKVYQMMAHLDALQYCLLAALGDKDLE